MIALSFGPPEHGWMDVELTTGPRSATYSVSDVPANSLLLLSEAVLRTARGELSNEAIGWNLEPTIWWWRWRTDGDHVELATGTDPSHLDSATLPVRAFVRAVTDALRRLEGYPIWAQDTDLLMWSWPFPAREVAALPDPSGVSRSQERG